MCVYQWNTLTDVVFQSCTHIKKPHLSLGRVDPAPHTQRLWRPFAAIAQNSSLRSLSIVDSFAHRQHYCRGLEELAIRKTARFRATPSSYQHSELLRVGGAQELRATSQAAELLRATPSGAQELRATQSQSELLQCTPSCSEHSQKLRATILRAQSLPSPELQALLSPYNK